MNNIENIKSQIASGKLELAIKDLLFIASKEYKQYHNQVILLSSQFHKWNENFYLGFNPDNSQMQLIIFGILNILDNIKTDSKLNTEQSLNENLENVSYSYKSQFINKILDEKTNVLIHLHPDFANQLRDIFHLWNNVQESIYFNGVFIDKKYEQELLTYGAISDDRASDIADEIRTQLKFGNQSGIIIFTEKRLYDGECYQLYVGGREFDEAPPNIGIISLDFVRQLFQNNSEQGYLFKSIISNILFSLGIDAGLKEHDNSKNCIMDYCNDMTEIMINLKSGLDFCPKCKSKIERKAKEYLINLVNVLNNYFKTNNYDKEISEKVFLRDKINRKIYDEFEYDIAISFSGLDRVVAEKLAQTLKSKNIKVFYDKFDEADLFGKELSMYLSDIYRFKARYCIILISNTYLNSPWTKFELKTALAREIFDEKEYILPIVLDNTEINGILPTKAYLNWNEIDFNRLIDIIISKLKI